jgi:hypothetical protein
MLSVKDQVVTLLTCISEVPSSILTRDIWYDMLWMGSEGNARSECEEDEGSDCEDEDSATDW